MKRKTSHTVAVSKNNNRSIGGIFVKKGLTELIFILDRSGSMGGLESDTIGGFNSLLEKQKKQEGEALVSTLLFDNEVQVLHDRVICSP